MKCKPCPPGYFSNQEGASQCTACSYFQFQAKEGWCIIYHIIDLCAQALLGGGRGGSHVAHLNFKTSRVRVYKCLSLIVSFAVTVAIWPREVVSCHDFILCAVATFWAMSLVGIYPGRASCTEIPPLSYSFNSQSS